MDISEVFDTFKALKKPLAAKEIENSEAFSFLYKSIKESNDYDFRSSIFTILLNELIIFDNKSYYFQYILKILKSSKFDIDQLSGFLFSISISKNPNKIRKKYFYLILSILIPKICYKIYKERDIKAFSIYMRVMSSIMYIEDNYILVTYVDQMLIFMREIAEKSNKTYDNILLNNLDVFKKCIELNECSSEDTAYFKELVDFLSSVK